MDSRFKILMGPVGLVFILCLCLHIAAAAAAAQESFCPKHCSCNKALNSVKCSRQKLTEIPQGIPQTTEDLDLSFNSIISITPRSFQNLTELVKLDLRSNKISSISENSFIRQKKLTFLMLINNDLNRIDKGAFVGATSLAKLYLSSNRLSAVPPLSGLVSLQKLALDTNQIFNLDFPPEFLNLNRLSDINVANNKISYLTNTTFINLKKNGDLRKLSLSRNQIKSIHPKAFKPLKSIESLKLSYNPLTSKDLQEGLSSLSRSNLNSLDISNLTFANELPASTFQSLVNSSLRTLILSYNHFGHINNNAFHTLPTLLVLKLISCGIQTIPKSAFHGLIHLNSLFLTKNELVNLNWDFPQRLQYLYLNDNKIQKIPEGVFGKLVNLKWLYLDYNKLHEFNKNAFVGLEKLQKLRLGHNSMNVIPSSLFSSLVGLESLELNSNSITVMPNTSFKSMTQLLYLNMANNYIMYLPPILLRDLQQLKYLYLSNNKLGSTSTEDDFRNLFGNHSKLNTLDLSNNQIHGVLSKNIFENLNNLNILNLAKNQISSWDPKTFSGNPLKSLDFSENHITTIEKPNLDCLKDVEVLKLAKNPFACNCQLRWFRDWLNNTHVSIPELKKLKCNSPKSWQGKYLLDFDRSKIDCTDYTPYYIYGGVAIGLITTLTLISVMYSYRWYIRFYVYKIGKTIEGKFHHQQGYAELPGHDFVFDMNVNYTDSDLVWVIENVMKNFDNGEFGDMNFEGKFKLCLKDRDIEPGPTMPTLLRNIENSRISLIVLTKHFKKENRCLFELDYCFRHFNYETSKIIIVTVGELRAHDIPNILKPSMEKDTYLKWEDNENAKQLFKQKLHDILDAERVNT